MTAGPRLGRLRVLRSARGRILGAQVLVVLLALAVAVVVTRQILLQRLDERIDRGLVADVAELRALATTGIDPSTGRPFTDVRTLLRLSLERSVPERNQTQLALVDGQVAARSAQRPPVRLDTDPEIVAQIAGSQGGELGSVETAAGTVRYAAVPVSVPGSAARGLFVTAAFRDLEAREVREVVGVLTVVGLTALAVATGVGWLLAGRVLQPVRVVRRTAEEISETDLSRRIPVEEQRSGGDDVSELARTFNHMLDRLETSFDAQRRFVADAGHELRSPITVISGQLELMGDDPDERRRVLALVEGELDRMARIVDDLLTLTTSERPGFVRPEPIATGALLDEVLAKGRGIADREWAIEQRADVVLHADAQRLTQALLQLVANAVQHTGPGDRVGLGARAVDGRVELWVHDSGPGVAPEDRERIFSRFARGTGAARAAHGAGLGLAIVEVIARAHDGCVRLVTPVDGGATFVLDLPVAPRSGGL